MIVKSLIAASCVVRFAGISNARERIMHALLGARTWSIFSLADGLLTPSTHPLQCTRRMAPKLLTSNYARIFPNQCIFTGAKSATELDYTFRIVHAQYRQCNRKCYSRAREVYYYRQEISTNWLFSDKILITTVLAFSFILYFIIQIIKAKFIV